jgi:hypothetical protein
MSRVEDIDPMKVQIGQRVRTSDCPGGEPPCPVFVPAEARDGWLERGSAAMSASRSDRSRRQVFP